MFEVSVCMNFSSAHNLRGYKGKCEALHGHNWKVELSLGSDTLDRTGMVEDFTLIKEKLKSVLSLLDHKYLNVLSYFKRINPTSENIARFIYLKMAERMKKEPLKVISVKVWETDTSYAIYRET
ncbi:MAG TPA: 6-carboxytetrahydropterin synthase QueD [Candidatus Omnitrophica bacterium]|nr:6-carboxytetrahydropterin synthase QueD [Candidatus Omnitrophota bacterium]